MSKGISEGIGSETGSSADTDSITVTDLAKRLDVTLPRLQRALKRPEFVGEVSQQQRATRTGTRTVTCVSITVLPALKAYFHAQVGEGAEQKRERLRPEPLPLSETPEVFRAFAAMLTQQMQERINEQATTIADLRAERDRAVRETETLRAEVLALRSQNEQQDRLIEARNLEQKDSGADQLGQVGMGPHTSLDSDALARSSASGTAGEAEQGDSTPARVPAPSDASPGHTEERRRGIRWPWQRRSAEGKG